MATPDIDDTPPLPAALCDELAARYAEPHRRYHTLDHVQALLRWLSRHRGLARRPGEIEAAIWFHDAVYDPRRHDNEARSAALARDRLGALGWPPTRAERIAAMVQATQHHQAEDGDTDLLLFLDLDLSVLAAPPEAYAAYARAIRAEFAWVEERAYLAGRSRVLASFLARPALYRTAALQADWEAPARRNLAAELQALAQAGKP